MIKSDLIGKGFNSDISSLFNFQRDKDYILTDSPIFEI